MSEEMTNEERDKRLRKAYGTATQDLRDKHRGDFDEFYSARATELGVTWTPRKSAEQKAAEQFDALVKEFPYLASRIAAVPTIDGEPAVAVENAPLPASE